MVYVVRICFQIRSERLPIECLVEWLERRPGLDRYAMRTITEE